MVIVESSDKMWSTGGGNGKPPQYICHENLMNYIKRQKDMTLKDESPRSEGVQYATGKEQRTTTNSSRKNEASGPTWTNTLWWMYLVKQVKSDAAKKKKTKKKKTKKPKQYCIGIWNVRSMNQGKLDEVKQEMARVNISILGINELKLDRNEWI